MDDTYWLLRRPRFEDYNREFFVNGRAYHSITLPYVTCPQCNIASGSGRVLGFRCPKSLYRALKALPRGSDAAVTWNDFIRFKEHVEPILHRKGHSIQLQPGDELQPLVWDVPSHPRQDFFWPLDFIVSRRVKALFEEHAVRGVEFYAVRCRRVGVLEPWEAFPSDGLSDPIGLFKMVPLLADPHEVGDFYEMIVRTRAPEIVLEEHETCSFCGVMTDYDGIPQSILNIEPSAYVRDIDVFIWSGAMLVVSEKVADLVRSYDLRGADIAPLLEWDKLAGRWDA